MEACSSHPPPHQLSFSPSRSLRQDNDLLTAADLARNAAELEIVELFEKLRPRPVQRASGNVVMVRKGQKAAPAEREAAMRKAAGIPA